MNWDILMSTYPTQSGAILGIKSLREKIDRSLDALDIPVLQSPCRKTEDLIAFIPLLTPACSSVWKDTTGSDPLFDMAEALRSFMHGEDIPSFSEADMEIMEAIINNAVSRFLHLLREKNAHLLQEEWAQGDCPFCGSLPRIGFDAEDARTLACLSCGHSWRFPRLACPTCGNTDHNTLGYFDAEGIAGVRVYFCRECGHYVKIIDTRARTPQDPDTEDALTLEMDELAQQEGFSPVQ